MSKHSTGSAQSGPLREAGGKGGRPYFENMPITLDPDWVVEYNDFRKAGDYNTTDFTQTLVDGGADSAQVISVTTGVSNGELKSLTNDADNDSNAIQEKVECYKLVSGKKLYFEAKVKVSDADDCDWMLGLSITDTTPNDSSDRVNFQIDEGNASVLCQNAKNSTETSTDSAFDASDDTYFTVGFLADGVGSIQFYVNRNKVATHTTNICDDEEMCLTFFIQTGAAAAKSSTLDYYFIAKER